ncbi:MAG: hypothetical protein AB203_01995 [Parcubacteria bacterium C7867-008]|nr:MAG: hypothetical protein AB203_01995 [Parcubacteria bacterium C7867-008]
MKRSVLTLALLLALFVSTVPVLAKAPTGFESGVSTSELQQAYADGTIHILIVPGHEPMYGGAVYQGVYERELTVEISNKLSQLLEQNPHYEVTVARTGDAWNPSLNNYFDRNMKSIKKFVDTQKKLMKKLVRKGTVEERGEEEQVDHATAPDDVALRLYGINKWANENDVDLVLSLHINDAPDHGEDTPSAYAGFAAYVPDPQYGNAGPSRDIAEAIVPRLSALNAVSTLPGEGDGVVEDQELIAIGSYGTLLVPSVLLEYGYITEPKFTNTEVRKTVADDYAYQTYLGLQDFFKAPISTKYPTLALPYQFAGTPAVGSSSPAVYSLQAGLHTLGFYPAATSSSAIATHTPSLALCSVSGLMNGCTIDAIKAFQKKNSLEQTGALGPKTRTLLNSLIGI